jgi:hypothetical protein
MPGVHRSDEQTGSVDFEKALMGLGIARYVDFEKAPMDWG